MKGIWEIAVEPGAPVSMGGFYLYSMACIGVIFPREAEGSRMVLVYPGFPRDLALPWLQPVCPGLAPGEQAQGVRVLDFLFLQSSMIQSGPGETLPSPHPLLPPHTYCGVVLIAALLPQTSFVRPSLLHPLEAQEGRDASLFTWPRWRGGHSSVPWLLIL